MKTFFFLREFLFSSIDEHQNDFIATLKEAVSIPSVSSEPNHRQDCVDMVMWTKEVKITKLFEIPACGQHILPDI